MTSKTAHLNKLGLLKAAPKFLHTAVQYEVVMGSFAYGVSRDDSDMDIYGVTIKELLLNCLEQHYGSLENCIVSPEKNTQALQEIQKILDGLK